MAARDRAKRAIAGSWAAEVRVTTPQKAPTAATAGTRRNCNLTCISCLPVSSRTPLSRRTCSCTFGPLAAGHLSLHVQLPQVSLHLFLIFLFLHPHFFTVLRVRIFRAAHFNADFLSVQEGGTIVGMSGGQGGGEGSGENGEGGGGGTAVVGVSGRESGGEGGGGENGGGGTIEVNGGGGGEAGGQN